MRRVEQHVIERSHPQFRAIDGLAFASKNLWNLANYHVRQSFIFHRISLNNTAIFHLLVRLTSVAKYSRQPLAQG
jgi:putative transposase